MPLTCAAAGGLALTVGAEGPSCLWRGFPSGGEGTRTLDLRLAKPPLFQLSYTPGAIASAGLLCFSLAAPS